VDRNDGFSGAPNSRRQWGGHDTRFACATSDFQKRDLIRAASDLCTACRELHGSRWMP